MSKTKPARGRRPDVLRDPVGPTLIRLALPMVAGIASIMLFNVVDTFWVGQLGDHELAAMSFTFPVVFVVMSLSMGLGIGTSSVVARAIGHGDERRVKRLTTDSLLLSVVVVTLVGLAGVFTIEPLFAALGAEAETIELITTYMVPWYLGVGLVVIPMVGNAAIRATGDTRTPSLVMVAAGVVNLALDPLLIFGLGPFPRLELQGAAIATVISYAVALLAALWILGHRLHLIDWARPRLGALWRSWRELLYVGVPAAGTMMMMPLASAILTRFLAEEGPNAVAAYGVGTRLESIAMIFIGALSSALAPFVGQNVGSGERKRVAEAVRFAIRAALVIGAAAALAMAVAGSALASAFSDSAAISALVVVYLSVVPLSYGTFGASQLVSAAYNAANRPLHASAIVATRLFVLAIPLAWVGFAWAGAPGVFVGVAVGNLVIGAIAYLAARRSFFRLPAPSPAATTPPAGGLPAPERTRA